MVVSYVSVKLNVVMLKNIIILVIIGRGVILFNVV